MRTRSLIALGTANTLLAVGLVSGCKNLVEAPQPIGASLVPAESSQMYEDFEKIKGWYEQTLGGVAATKLVILQGNETFICPSLSGQQNEVTTSASIIGNYYCSTRDTVLLTAGFVDMYNNVHPRSASALLWRGHAHELGHAYQQSQGNLRLGERTQVQVVESETQATCFAGAAIGALYPDTVQNIADITAKTPTDNDHGSAQEQASAFLNGAHNGVGAC